MTIQQHSWQPQPVCCFNIEYSKNMREQHGIFHLSTQNRLYARSMFSSGDGHAVMLTISTRLSLRQRDGQSSVEPAALAAKHRSQLITENCH
jgi:hypothetical protein